MLKKLVKMNSKGEVIIPKVMREALNMKPGDTVIVKLVGDQAVIAKKHLNS
jgi:AbrB family looped-hinge helix DNA binding protein